MEGDRGILPQRHLDMASVLELRMHIELLREITGYRIPILVRMYAGYVEDDLRIAMKAGADSIILILNNLTMGNREGYGTHPDLGVFPGIRNNRHLNPEFTHIPIGVQLNIDKGSDITKCLAMGADYVVTLAGWRCGKCERCGGGAPCGEISPLFASNKNMGEGKLETPRGNAPENILADTINGWKKDIATNLVALSLSGVKQLSHKMLSARNYSTAAVTGLELAGFGKKLPLWLH